MYLATEQADLEEYSFLALHTGSTHLCVYLDRIIGVSAQMGAARASQRFSERVGV